MLPIFYINMASRPDRRQHVERQLVAHGLTATRIDAVTPADFQLSPDSPLSSGELGCSRSHQKIWRLMVENNIAAALILEDDVLLADEVPALLADPSLLAGGVEAIQLETRGFTRPCRLSPSSSTRRSMAGVAPARATSTTIG